jgi:hypothetical protein
LDQEALNGASFLQVRDVRRATAAEKKANQCELRYLYRAGGESIGIVKRRTAMIGCATGILQQPVRSGAWIADSFKDAIFGVGIGLE